MGNANDKRHRILYPPYKGTKKAPQEIGQELNADSLAGQADSFLRHIGLNYLQILFTALRHLPAVERTGR